ncbi:MAG TPA: hypothetical protein DCP91_07345, partial [Eggerthellaceae bacterium]|nr:hypothetical protein [Eggerthellaceae bacterium]
ETIALGEGNTFALPVKWVKEFGNPDTLESLLGGSFVVSFRSVKNNTWYERQFTVSEADGTLTIDNAPAERTDLTITNNTGMFKAVSGAAVANADGSYALTFALSGSGYAWLYKGTYEQALAANAEIEAGIDAGVGSGNLMKGETNAAGKLEFQMAVSADELGADVPVVAISNSYWSKYKSGQNAQERAYYPRQFSLDVDAATLVTGDYDETASFVLSSEVADFKADSPAAVRIVGGPNSNNYNMQPTFAMQDAVYDKVTYPTVVSGDVSTATAELTEGKFAISLLNAPNKEAFKDKEPIAMTFHVAADAPFQEAGTDIVRNVTFDQLARTITVTGEPLTPKAAELTAGTYEAANIKTDVSTDASGMIMVTKATVVIDAEGNATAIVTMKGTGADRFYISDTAATHEALLSEAVAEEAKEISGQESKLLGCYQKEGESAYTFWPVPITLGQPKVYAARSASHFKKWDTPRENYYYVHDFQIDAADLTRVSDSTSIMTPEQDAEVYMNQFYVDNGISSDHTSAIKAKGTNVTVPYYEGEDVVKSFKFKTPSNDKYVWGWFVDSNILNTTYFTSSNLKKIQYPYGNKGATAGVVTFQPKNREAIPSFTATLKLFPVGTYYNAYDANGIYYFSDSGKTNAATPLIEKTFTITVQEKPQVDFNVSVAVADQKTGETIANPTVTIVDEADNSAVEPNADGTYKLNALKKYTVSASAEGYLAQGGAEAATKTGFVPSKEGEVVNLKLLKTADASHTLTISIADQFGEAVANPAVKVWLYGTTDEVAANADGSYTLWDSESYVCEVSAEGYETAKIYPKLTEDAAESITLNKYLSEHTVIYTIRDADTDEVLEGVTLAVTNNTAGGTIAQNADGSFTVPADTSITCVASKEGYLNEDFTHVPSGFDPVVKCSFSLKINYENQLKAEIAAATEYAGGIVEAEGPGKWPAGTKTTLEAAIADAQAVLGNAASTETEFEAALAALKAAEKAAKDAQYACVADVTVRVNKTPGGAAELYKLAVSADASKTYKYAEPAIEGKQVTFLDVLVAVHETIYGDAFKADPKSYFDSQNVGFYYIAKLFELGNYYQFALNGESVSNYQKCIVADGSTADVSILSKTNDVFLSFGELEAEASAEADFTATLTKGVGNPTPAEGYTVTYADEAGNEVSGVSDAEGKVTVVFPAAGTYTVKGVASESASQTLVQPYQKVAVGPAKLAAGKYIIDGTCWNTKKNTAFTMVGVTYGGQAGKALLTVAEDGSATVTFDTDTRSTYNGVYLGALGSQAAEGDSYVAGESNGKGGYLITVPVDPANLTQDISIVPHKPAGSWYTSNPLVLRFGDVLTPLAVSEVEQLIAALPVAADVVATDKEAIQAARAAYDALSAEHQALVSNYDKLAAAEEAFANLPAMSDEAKAAAAAIGALINSYPQVNEASATAVAEARAAYDALDNVQKSYIPAETYDKLVRAEACVEFANSADVKSSIIVDPCNPIDGGVFIGAVIKPMNNNTTTLWLYTTKGGFDKIERLESTNPANGGSVNPISGSTSLQRIYISMSTAPQGNEYRMKLLDGTQDTGMTLAFKVPSVYGTMREGAYSVLAQDPSTKAGKFENVTIASDGTSMTATFAMPSASYDKIFLGNAADAAAATEGFIAPNEGTGNTFTIPLQSMYQPIEISCHSAAGDAWTTEAVEFVVDEQTQAAVDAIAKLNVKNYWDIVADQREDVNAAIAAYDALDGNQKALMANSNYHTLEMVAPMFVVT